VRYFSEKSGNRHKKRRTGQARKKERKEDLWKLAPPMEIRKERGFPQRLEKSLANDARLFHSSHRSDGGDQLRLTQINQ
jgi:hypothetical protein